MTHLRKPLIGLAAAAIAAVAALFMTSQAEDGPMAEGTVVAPAPPA